MSKRPKSKEFIESDDDSNSGSEKPKKTKESSKKVKTESEDTSEPSWPIGKKRRVSVSEFKGRRLVNIREYYTTESGEERPGRKGISLSIDQWKELCKVVDDVNKAIEG